MRSVYKRSTERFLKTCEENHIKHKGTQNDKRKKQHKSHCDLKKNMDFTTWVADSSGWVKFISVDTPLWPDLCDICFYAHHEK